MTRRIALAVVVLTECLSTGCSSDPASSGSPASPASVSSLLLVAAAGEGTGQATLGCSFDVATQQWSTGTPLSSGVNGAIESPNGGVALAFTGSGSAIALLTAPTNTSDASSASGPIQFATWSSAAWAPFAALASNVAASGAPSLSQGSAALEVAFAKSTGSSEANATLTNGAWSSVTALGASVGGPPSIAVRGGDATVVYVRSSDGALVAVDRTNGAWGSEGVIQSGTATAAAVPVFAPSLVALSSGPELMVVFTDSSMSDLHFATRSSGQWSAVHDFGLPTAVVNTDPSRPNTGAGDGPNPSFATPVLALPNGKAILAFTSVNQYAYFSEFDGTSWSTASTVFNSWGLDTIDSAQLGLAAGVGTSSAEIVFGGSPSSSGTYVPYHTRLIAGRWTAPQPVPVPVNGASNFAMYALASD